jgi:hypothetical protein
MIAIFMGASGLFNPPQWNYFKPKAIYRQVLLACRHERPHGSRRRLGASSP